MIDNCIFCKIIDGKLPSYKIYENEHAIAFLDINPINPGHVLVIPKKHFKTLNEMDENPGIELFKTVMHIEKVVAESGCVGTNVFQNNGKQAGQEIEHVHFHIVPRYPDDSFRFKFKKTTVSEEMIKYSLDYYRSKLT